jgi:hypothetical protein
MTFEEFKQDLFHSVFNVYEVFKNFYGEEFVDLQGIPTEEEYGSLSEEQLNAFRRRFRESTYSIYVWWPRVTVSNEYDRCIDIQDLYAKINIDINGRIPYEHYGFMLTRSTFSKEQWLSGYCHSHVPSLRGGVPTFEHPCLGTGPIRNTIVELKNSNEEALWMLFCQELAMYVTVESISGGPYIRMESIGAWNESDEYRNYNFFRCELQDWVPTDQRDAVEKALNTFKMYYIDNGHLKIGFRDGLYASAMPYFDFIIDISNCYIKWYNDTGRYDDDIFEVTSSTLLKDAKISNKKIYTPKGPYSRTLGIPDGLIGREMFMFKDQTVRLNIRDDDTDNEEMENVHILNSYAAMYVLYKILITINYNYGNTISEESSGTVATAV